jgi:hypothetical protein
MKKVVAGAAAVSVALLAFGGTAWAAPRPSETITITVDVAHPDGPSPVTATGAFTGTGTDVRTSHIAKRVVHARDVLTFDAGTVTVRDIGRRTTKLDTSTSTSTCTRTFTERGVWQIRKGTGTFAHAKGQGHYKATGTINGVQGTNGCDFTAPTGTITVTATGHVNGKVKA